MTDDRKAFEAWWHTQQGSIGSRHFDHVYMAAPWAAWQAATAAALERAAQMLDAEHEKRKHLDNHAAFYARMIREMKGQG